MANWSRGNDHSGGRHAQCKDITAGRSVFTPSDSDVIGERHPLAIRITTEEVDATYGEISGEPFLQVALEKGK